MVSTKRVCGSTECSLNIISRNYSNNFLLINKQKTAARLVSSRASLTSWEEGDSLVLVGNPSSDGVMIKNGVFSFRIFIYFHMGWMFYYIDQPFTSYFPIGLVGSN